MTSPFSKASPAAATRFRHKLLKPTPSSISCIHCLALPPPFKLMCTKKMEPYKCLLWIQPRNDLRLCYTPPIEIAIERNTIYSSMCTLPLNCWGIGADTKWCWASHWYPRQSERSTAHPQYATDLGDICRRKACLIPSGSSASPIAGPAFAAPA